jgi:glycosyltransferase involved in cell wall biosynthesis
MSAKLPLTVVIPTLNEAKHIADLVPSLAWADEVIVADGGSTDETVAIARGLGATVIELRGQSLGAQRNAGIEAARHPWVLALDADERVTDALRKEVAGVVAGSHHEAYRIRFENVYLGRVRHRGRWGRDWHIRLFKRERRFADSRIHPDLEAIGDVGTLQGTIRHVPYRDLTHHLEKMIAYARWGAEELHARGRRASLWDLVMRPWWRFVRDYFIYGSCLDGRYGFVASALTAYAAFLKYAYLWNMTERPAAG